MRSSPLAVLALFLGACGGSETTAPPVSKQLTIVNYLYVGATITVDGVAYGSVSGGNAITPQTITLTLPGSARNLTYTLIPLTFSNGTPVPRDLVSETVALSNSDATLGLNNVVAGKPYFYFGLTNSTSQSLDVGLFSSGGVRCLATVSPGVFPFGLGYYAFTGTTEVRTYRSGTGCTGPSLSWSNTQLAAMDANTGALRLTATTVP